MFFHVVTVFFNVFLQSINDELTFKNGSYWPWTALLQYVWEFPNMPEKAQYRDFCFHNRGAMQRE